MNQVENNINTETSDDSNNVNHAVLVTALIKKISSDKMKSHRVLVESDENLT